MNVKIPMKKSSGYLWGFISIMLSGGLLINIFISDTIINNHNIFVFIIVFEALIIIYAIMNAFVILSGRKYLLITDMGLEIKRTFFKPKIVFFEEIKSAQLNRHLFGQVLHIQTKKKTYYLADGFQKSIIEIKQIIYDRIN